jgi:GMP synthase (glutamine-hydrolysing)
VQLHPEVHHTKHGNQILKNFVLGICGCKADWRMRDFVDRTIEEIREYVGDRRVVCAVSGGVDSTVLAVLLHRALGKKLVPVFVDNGVLRQNEVEVVKQRFAEVGIDIKVARSASKFLKALKGSATRRRSARSLGARSSRCSSSTQPTDLLAQGTLYPDVIESVSTKGRRPRSRRTTTA